MNNFCISNNNMIYDFIGYLIKQKVIASSGTRTRVNCLEGSYPNHQTNDAELSVLTLSQLLNTIFHSFFSKHVFDSTLERQLENICFTPFWLMNKKQISEVFSPLKGFKAILFWNGKLSKNSRINYNPILIFFTFLGFWGFGVYIV